MQAKLRVSDEAALLSKVRALPGGNKVTDMTVDKLAQTSKAVVRAYVRRAADNAIEQLYRTMLSISVDMAKKAVTQNKARSFQVGGWNLLVSPDGTGSAKSISVNVSSSLSLGEVLGTTLLAGNLAPSARDFALALSSVRLTNVGITASTAIPGNPTCISLAASVTYKGQSSEFRFVAQRTDAWEWRLVVSTGLAIVAIRDFLPPSVSHYLSDVSLSNAPALEIAYLLNTSAQIKAPTQFISKVGFIKAKYSDRLRSALHTQIPSIVKKLFSGPTVSKVSGTVKVFGRSLTLHVNISQHEGLRMAAISSGESAQFVPGGHGVQGVA